MECVGREYRGLRVEYYIPRHVIAGMQRPVLFRPPELPGGTGVDLWKGRVVYGEISRYWDGMMPYPSKLTRQIPQPVRMAVRLIVRGVPTKRFNKYENYSIRLNNSSITINYAEWDSREEYDELVAQLVEDLWLLLQEQPGLVPA